MNSAIRNKNIKNNKRQQKKNNTEINENNLEFNVKWNTEDKKILLIALRKYGPDDITAISEMLPHISPEHIESKIAEYSLIAGNEDQLLNKWLNCGLYNPGDSLLAEALLFIQLFEDHPPPSELGYDLRAIYNFLYRSCFEEPPFINLSTEDVNILYSLLSKIEEKSWPKYQKHLLEYVGGIYNKRHIRKVYPGKNTYSL